MKKFTLLNRLVIALIMLCQITVLHAITNNHLGFDQKSKNQFINYMVKKHGFTNSYLSNVFSKAQYQPEIISRMEKPYEKKDWDEYKALFLTDQRFIEGMKFWETNYKALAKAENKYHVPASIIVAILGVETLYGKHQGDFKVIDSLSTLAFNYPKRSKYFSYELEQYLLLCRDQKLDPSYYKGSYAGAIGQPQFMPSSFRRFAVSANNTKKIDLMNDNESVILSVANYFQKHGWVFNQGVAQPANVAKNAVNKIKFNQLSHFYLMSNLKKIGVTPVTAANSYPKIAGVLSFNTKNGNDYWLAYPNFYVITKYNTSPQYALVVYLLANQFQKKWAYFNNKHNVSYA